MFHILLAQLLCRGHFDHLDNGVACTIQFAVFAQLHLKICRICTSLTQYGAVIIIWSMSLYCDHNSSLSSVEQHQIQVSLNQEGKCVHVHVGIYRKLKIIHKSHTAIPPHTPHTLFTKPTLKNTLYESFSRWLSFSQVALFEIFTWKPKGLLLSKLLGCVWLEHGKRGVRVRFSFNCKTVVNAELITEISLLKSRNWNPRTDIPQQYTALDNLTKTRILQKRNCTASVKDQYVLTLTHL